MSDSDLGPSDPSSSQGVPGHWVVLGMFAFAIFMTGLLWTYTKYHNAPFIPLRHALAKEYSRKSSPRVEGGRHRDGPMTLRVVLNVEFNPNLEADNAEERMKEMTARIIELARQNLDLGAYEWLDIFYVLPVPEGVPERREFHLKVAELPPQPVEVGS